MTQVMDPNAYRVLNQRSNFTPAVTFGGNAVGVTYNTTTDPTVGHYILIGDMCFFDLKIVLTNNGSSTGALKVTNLPFTANSATSASIAVNNLNGAVTDTHYQAIIEASTTSISLSQVISGTLTNLLDTDTLNNTNLWISGSYQIQ